MARIMSKTAKTMPDCPGCKGHGWVWFHVPRASLAIWQPCLKCKRTGLYPIPKTIVKRKPVPTGEVDAYPSRHAVVEVATDYRCTDCRRCTVSGRCRVLNLYVCDANRTCGRFRARRAAKAREAAIAQEILG